MGAIAVTEITLAAAVADAGTFTLAYPAGTTQASLTGAAGGRMVVNYHDAWDQDAGDFAVSYGASTITITNNTGYTLAAGSVVTISFGRTQTAAGGYNVDVMQAGPASLTMTVGTASSTIADVGASFNQTTLNNNMRSLGTQINALQAVLKAAGLLR